MPRPRETVTTNLLDQLTRAPIEGLDVALSSVEHVFPRDQQRRQVVHMLFVVERRHSAASRRHGPLRGYDILHFHFLSHGWESTADASWYLGGTSYGNVAIPLDPCNMISHRPVVRCMQVARRKHFELALSCFTVLHCHCTTAVGIMGIPGLLRLLRSIEENVHVSAYANQRVAIDAYRSGRQFKRRDMALGC